MNSFRRIFADKLSYLIVGAVVLVVVSISLPAHALITGADAMTPELDPSLALHRLLSSWNYAAGLGAESAFQRPLLVPIIFVDWLLRNLGLSALAVNHFWIYVIALMQSLLTLRLFRQLFPDNRALPAEVFVGVAAVVNPFFLIWIHGLFPTTLLACAAFPGIVAAFLRYVLTGKPMAVVEFFLYNVVALCGWVNPAVFMVQIPLMGMIALLFAFRRFDAATLPRLAQLGLFYVGLNMMFGLPIALATRHALLGFVSAQAQYSLDTLHVTSLFSSLGNSVRLVGEYTFFNKVGPQLFLPEGPSYVTNPVVIAGTLALPILALSSLFFQRYRKRAIIILSVIAIALFFAKGTAWPAGNIFAWLSDHVTLFQAFRNSFDKFEWLVAIGYALLAGLTLSSIRLRTSRMSIPVAAGSFILLGIAAYPMFTGDLFWRQLYVKIPASYVRVANFLNAQPGDDRALQLPVAPVLWDTYQWGYVGAGIHANLVGRPLLTRLYDSGLQGNTAIDDAFQRFRTGIGDSQVSDVLGLYHIGFVVQDDSFNLDFFAPGFSDQLRVAPRGLKAALNEGSLHVYQIDAQFVNPFIYAPARVVTGPTDVPQIGMACRIIGSCKSVAFVASDSTRRLGSNCCTTFTFDTAASFPATAKSFGISAATWERPSIVSKAIAVPRPFNRPGELTLFDYGNQSVDVATPLAPSALLYGDAPPVRIDLRAVDRWNTPQRLCADPYGVLVKRLPLDSAQLRKGINIIAVTYSSDAALPALKLLNDVSGTKRGFTVALLSNTQNTTYMRLFQPSPEDRSLALWLLVKGTDRPGCVTFTRIIVANAVGSHEWKLLGDPGRFYPTSPYFAANADILAKNATQLAAIKAVTPLDTRSAVSAISDVSAVWEAPEPVGEPPARVFGVRADRLRSPNGREYFHIETKASGWDVRSHFSHLLPAATYELTIPLVRTRGDSATVAVNSDTGQRLATAFVASRQGLQMIRTQFQLPENVEGFDAYFYTGTENYEDTSTDLGVATLEMLNVSPTYVTRLTNMKLSTPQRITTRRAGSTDWIIHVQRAPKEFMLVMNSSFSEGWKISAPPGVHATHVEANLFENGWVVSGIGTYDLRLSYAWGNDGRAALLAGLALCSIAAVWILLASRPRILGVVRGNRR
ncbi:MAG TPA: alpha-(1-_3)-arabinofuranosyltransferase family protein [Candidatus Tumulicola sp.]|nr:alpha-(1->3)-arabinofuranosyltransferase family protein [Candidatus Tumulicola sp.]